MKKILAITMFFLVFVTMLTGCRKLDKSSVTFIGNGYDAGYKLDVQAGSKNVKLLSYGIADHLLPTEINDRLLKDINLGKMNITSVDIVYKNSSGGFCYNKGNILNVRIYYLDKDQPGKGNKLRLKLVNHDDFFVKDKEKVNTNSVGVKIFDYLVLYKDGIDQVYVFYFED